MTSPLQQLINFGQSIWYDNIERRLLENGELAAMIERGEIRGVTSNPTIFQNAIARSNDYDTALIPMAWAGWNAEQIFWQLAIEDIRAACDLFLPLYRQTDGADGYVSLEVNPRLAHDTVNTASEARRLWAAVDRPNLMIKIPATVEGLPAIRLAVSAGINVNVTLIFSIARYQQVMDAYLAGLEDRLAAGQPIGSVASVASFFVSRIDTKADHEIGARAPHLLGKVAIANAKLAYQEYRQVFESERFARLQAKCARVQRPLWASTGTKNPAYPDTLYVDSLIGPETVNTVPPVTLAAFRDRGTPAATLQTGLEEAHRVFADAEALGVSVDAITAALEVEGVKAFVDAFDALLQTVDDRRKAAVAELATLATPVAERVARLERESVPARLWAHDPTLWTSVPSGQDEVRRRLGWLDLPHCVDVRPFTAFAAENPYKKTLLLGMGGSSLAPEVTSLVFDMLPAAGNFAILDSTDPGQVLATAADFPVRETLFIVSSKSGTTAEVNAFLEFFWARCVEAFGEEKAGEHFIAITDPGTSLETLAAERCFRATFISDPHVGGRFSVLSPFGLVPAAVMGVDVPRFQANAAEMAAQCGAEVPAARNPGLVLGTVVAEAAQQGSDKLTVFADDPWCSFGSWLEQLVAESSGKNGVGIVPVDLEPPAGPKVYGRDRLFVYLRQSGRHDQAVSDLKLAGFPVLTLPLVTPYDLAAEFYRWEFATAVACAILNVNAFDQPDVQDSKDRTKAKIKEYQDAGKLADGKRLDWSGSATDLLSFLATAKAGDYVALNAYLPRNPEMEALLTRLRMAVRARTGCATTVGFGPRFLHSTGQLHKGGADNGVFVQITADPVADADIPTQGMTFGTLERAQALGDFEALQARGRRALRLHLPNPAALAEVVEAVEKA
ncbi:MAG: bifunctional transaldolase/phosoglucose isomerase [Chloroflexota bacterium]